MGILTTHLCENLGSLIGRIEIYIFAKNKLESDLVSSQVVLAIDFSSVAFRLCPFGLCPNTPRIIVPGGFISPLFRKSVLSSIQGPILGSFLCEFYLSYRPRKMHNDLACLCI
jgi:hypothetical protein